MKIIPVLLVAIFIQVNLSGQPVDKQKKNDIATDKVLYTVGYAHLDTEWLWDYPSTINEYIKNTIEENFLLFEKYPDYVFNFTGSRRYNMMKEYYPSMYEKVKEYINKKRWNVSGSSVDEGEVNISSSESLIRQVLYGNEFFRKEFGVVSQDYMLPDCFGFLANTPSIWNHCGLLGFSTQKLTWNAAVDLPFNVGIWNGPDGKGIIAALNATDYGGHIGIRLDKDSLWNARMDNNFKKYGFYFDYRYFGVGDQGGAPFEDDVKHAVGSLNNFDSKIKVVLSSSDQMYKDITPELRKKLPVYSGDLLLIEHSAGSLTSQAYMKRINRKNENLAQSAEQMSSVATMLMGADYPMTKINNSWDLVLGSQFHDILPGTSIPVAYEYAWNDEFIAANGFSESLKNALGNISAELNTTVNGRAVNVYNPVATNREDVAVAELEYTSMPSNIKVIASNGQEIPSQILSANGNKLKFIFLAKVPSLGMSVFDVQEVKEKTLSNSVLSVSSNSLVNTFYNITLDKNGDMSSIYDKRLKKEILLKPARLEFLHEKPSYWSAWNMDWNDRKNPPIDYLDGNVSVKVLEKGPVRVALEVTRKKRNSEITQIISLSLGEAGKRIEITNKLDWQSTGVSLKASFPLVAENENATYNLGVGAIQRSNNNPKKFEVPSKQWFDLTDKSGKFGVSILEDCKYGSDKPDNNTLRLTLLYTPEAHKDFIHQGSQDWGIHDIKYGLYCHSGNWTEGETQWQAEFLNKPFVVFEAPKHSGFLGKSVSFLSFNNPKVGLMAFKKSETGDYFIVRMNELAGSDQKDINVKFNSKIEDAYEVNGQEQKTGNAHYSGNTIDFDLSHFTIRTFAVKFQPQTNKAINQMPVTLTYNKDVISFDRNRADGSFIDGESYPAELFPAELTSEGIVFKLGSTEDEENNVINCQGQTISFPSGVYNKVYLLAAATEDVKADFEINSNKINLAIQDKSGFVGQFYNRVFSAGWKEVLEVKAPFVKRSNIAWYASHQHIGYPSKNEAYKYAYIYKYEIDLPDNVKSIKLPDDKRIMIFAITLAQKTGTDIKLSQPLTDDFSDNKLYTLESKN